MSDGQRLAADIVKKLVEAGYTAYFAGGWVRDFMMGHPSDDIDIATNAPPEVILDMFPRTIAVGISFGVVVVLLEGHQFEVATFRKDVSYKNGRTPHEIELSTPYEDALRRDFTINGMFYDPLEHVVHDFVNGAEDIKRGVIRSIGNPHERFYEDRLRMIRAVRFSARFGFPIDNETREAIRAHAQTLFPPVAMERVWQELVKMSKFPHFDQALIEMHRLELLQEILPALRSLHLQEIKERVRHFAEYPKETPTILYVMMLFPDIMLDEVEPLCRWLRISVQEIRIAKFLVHCRERVKAEEQLQLADAVEWVHLYASPYAQLCLGLIASPLEEQEKAAFIQKHRQRRQALDGHVQRAIEKKPLISAAKLLEAGIPEGKKMGLLLKEAERIAIIENIENATLLMEKLKSTSLWGDA